MIKGIGIDTVNISEIAGYLESDHMSKPYIDRTFSTNEQRVAAERARIDEYFATRFAAKEAVFKAVAHLLPGRHFDMRIVETLNYDDGSPYVNITGDLRPVLEAAGVDTLFISITTEDNYATAFVIACGETAENASF